MPPLLAEISDKVIQTHQVWIIMAILGTILGAIAIAWRSWAILLLAISISALGGLFILSFLDDPIFGDAMLQENGWPWFAWNLVACMLPTIAVIVALISTPREIRRHRHPPSRCQP